MNVPYLSQPCFLQSLHLLRQDGPCYIWHRAMRRGCETAEHLQNKTTAYAYGFPSLPVQYIQTSMHAVEAVTCVQCPLEAMEKGANIASTLTVLCSDTCELGQTPFRCSNCPAPLMLIQPQLLMALKVFIATFNI